MGRKWLKGRNERWSFKDLCTKMPVLCTEQHLPPVPMHSWYLCLPALCMQSAMWYETQSKKFDNFKYVHVCKWDSAVYMCECMCACCNISLRAAHHKPSTLHTSFIASVQASMHQKLVWNWVIGIRMYKWPMFAISLSWLQNLHCKRLEIKMCSKSLVSYNSKTQQRQWAKA